MKAIVKDVLLFTDCFSVFSFAISSFQPEEDDRECFWVGGAVFRRGLIAVSSINPIETIASGSSIVTKTSTAVLSETHASQRGLTLIRVMRGSLWLGECLGRLAAGQELWSETSLDPASRVERVVVCNICGRGETGNKNDRLDADRLSELLRLGSL